MKFDKLANSISRIQDILQKQVAHAINQGLTVRNWLIGCYIVEFEQHGEDRAAYGEKLLKQLEERINSKGMTERRFREFRQFYKAYPQLARPVLDYLEMNVSEIRQPMVAELKTIEKGGDLSLIEPHKLFNRLPYTHLSKLSRIENPLKRCFYEVETIAGCWTKRELERQIDSLYYERSGFSTLITTSTR